MDGSRRDRAGRALSASAVLRHFHPPLIPTSLGDEGLSVANCFAVVSRNRPLPASAPRRRHEAVVGGHGQATGTTRQGGAHLCVDKSLRFRVPQELLGITRRRLRRARPCHPRTHHSPPCRGTHLCVPAFDQSGSDTGAPTKAASSTRGESGCCCIGRSIHFHHEARPACSTGRTVSHHLDF